MLHKATTLTRYSLQTLDGEIGKVKDFYFDDRDWSIRYLVADTGEWLVGRQVLISPHSLAGVYGGQERVALKLTKAQIEHSPTLNSDEPVSRQFEQDYAVFFSAPMYWGFPHGPGAKAESGEPGKKHADPDLRSTHDVTGHHVEASDGEIGHVEDFLIDDETWAVRYMIVDTRDWLPGKRVLISPKWIERISWDQREVVVDLSRKLIEQAPEYTDLPPLTRDQEVSLHRHYDRNGYWTGNSDSVDDFELSRRYPRRFSA